MADERKNIITGELIYAADIAYQMRDTIDWKTRAYAEYKFRPKISTKTFQNFIENFMGFFLRTRTYIKKEDGLVKEIGELFENKDLNNRSTKHLAKCAFELCDRYIDAVNRSELIKLIREVTSLQQM